MGSQTREAQTEDAQTSDGGDGRWEVPIYFALLTPRAGAHVELLALLQTKIVAPLIHRRILSQFRVLTTTPPSFKVEAATLIVFELTVPCPWPITEWDVRQWQRRLGSGVHLVVEPGRAPRRVESWDTDRARSALARAMVLPPARRSAGQAHRKQTGSWIATCVDRASVHGLPGVIPATTDLLPSLSVIVETTGCRVQLSPGATLMSTAIAVDLCQHLPVSLRWRTAWRLAYCPLIHGVSLKTFYRRMQEEHNSLLLVQDHTGCVFGGFATAPWHAADRYFGSGESFVFRFRRLLPKPLLSLLRHTQRSAEPQSSDSSPQVRGRRGREEAKEEVDTIRQAMKVLQDWHPRVRAEAERADRAAAADGRVTSPTEALDEVLGRHAANDAPAERLPLASATEPPAPEGGAAAAPAAPNGEDSDAPQAVGSRGSVDPVCSAEDAEAPGVGPMAVECELSSEQEPEGEDGGDLGLEAFHWSLRDPFFLFSDMECIAMGGGSSFALYLEKDFLHGMSEPCSTFENEVLASTDHFIISNFECWVFDDPSEAGKPQ